MSTFSENANDTTLKAAYSAAAGARLAVKRTNRSAPFSVRLSGSERERLTIEAGGLPLGTYLRAKLLSGDAPPPRRRSQASIEDRKAIAQLLGLLGQKRYSNNLNQLAHLANLGLLAMTEDERLELALAIAHIAELRRLLIQALGLKSEQSE